MTNRTDIHRPGSPDFDPTQYDFHGVFDLGDETGVSPALRAVVVAGLLASGHTFTGSPHGYRQCGHCGAHLRYAALMTHRPTKVIMSVGETCLDERFHVLTKEGFARLRAASGNARRHSAKTVERMRRLAYLIERYPELAEVVDGSSPYLKDSEFLRSIHKSAARYALTQNQAEAVMRTVRHFRKRAAAIAEQGRPRRPVPHGRGRVVGHIASVKMTTNRDGEEFPALVLREERGFTIWGPLPEDLRAAHQEIDLRGERVAFTASLRGSGTDPYFGFFSRSSDVERLDD